MAIVAGTPPKSSGYSRTKTKYGYVLANQSEPPKRFEPPAVWPMTDIIHVIHAVLGYRELAEMTVILEGSNNRKVTIDVSGTGVMIATATFNHFTVNSYFYTVLAGIGETRDATGPPFCYQMYKTIHQENNYPGGGDLYILGNAAGSTTTPCP